MPIGKAVGLLLDFLFLPSMRVGQDGALSINLSEGVVVHYLSKGFVCKI
jgi:hypothetical protein